MEIYPVVSFPVIFLDGGVETDLGNIFIYPTINYKQFQATLSNMIGKSPNHFTTYIAKPPLKTLITAKINFAAVSQERDCFFLVVWNRRSRRHRRKQQKNNNENHHHQHQTNFFGNKPHDYVMMLRRDNHPLYFLPQDRLVMEMKKMEMELYLMSICSSQEEGGGSNNDGNEAVCDKCDAAKEMEFHWCVQDPVTSGFRSLAGPIARPNK